GATERHVDDRALVGHQRRQRLDLVLVYAKAEADAALGGEVVMAVLGAPGVDDLDRSVVPPDRKRDLVDVVARLDDRQKLRIVAGERRRAVEVLVDLLEKADGHFLGLRDYRPIVTGPRQASGSRQRSATGSAPSAAPRGMAPPEAGATASPVMPLRYGPAHSAGRTRRVSRQNAAPAGQGVSGPTSRAVSRGATA